MVKLDREVAKRDPAKIARIRRNLLDWYTVNHRDLPWRRNPDPYSVWVSEIMLQQTRVVVVIERFQSFLARFPTVIALALASEQDVLAEWSGLGYYRRARMLHKAAQFLAANNDGNLPTRAVELRTLPGIGPYTAAAIASIAHHEAVAVVDGNVERVLCRLEGWEHGQSTGAAVLARKIETQAQALVDIARPGDFNQAVMELGATVCLPRNPQCVVCPLVADCKTQGEHKTAPRPRMLSREVAFALCLRDRETKVGVRSQIVSEVLLDQRPDSQTVMPGLWELPALNETTVPDHDLRMTVRHAIMQVNYYVRIRTVREGEVEALSIASTTRRWVPLTEAANLPLTGLARKVLMRAHLFPGDPPHSVVHRGRPASQK
jgi:A/G-specific adenine glycosylase